MFSLRYLYLSAPTDIWKTRYRYRYGSEEYCCIHISPNKVAGTCPGW